MELNYRALLINILILFAAFLIQAKDLHITGFEHRSNDEFLYYKSTQEMIQNSDYLSPTFFGQDRFEKPVLFYWFILISYKLFGISWASARLVSVFLGSLTVLLTWLIARRFFDKKLSLLSCLLLMSTPLFFAHTRTAVPDMPLNFFIVFAFYAFMRFLDNPQEKVYRILFFISCALGFMVKGFPALTPVLGLLVYVCWTRQFALLRRIGFLSGVIIFSLIVAPWFVYMISVHGQSFLTHVMTHEVEHRLISFDQGNVVFRILGYAAHNFFYYLGILWNNVAPWSLFLLAGLPYYLRRIKLGSLDREGLIFLLCWLFAVFFLFVFIALEQYNVQYLLILTTPAAILAAYILLQPLTADNRLAKAARFLRKFVCLFVFTVGYFIYGYFFVFFTSYNQVLVGMLVLLLYVLTVLSVKRSQNPFFPPFVLAALIIVITSQMSFFQENRLSQISALEEMAEMIHQDKTMPVVIGISRSVDPMKFWLFFDQKIEQGPLRDLLSHDKTVYVVLTQHQLKDQKDNEVFTAIQQGRTDELPTGQYTIVHESTIIAKKMSLDKGFFKALVLFDRKTVDSYVREKIYLIRKLKS